MATRDEILAELNRRSTAGEFNDQQQKAFAELQRRGVIPESRATAARIPDYLGDVLKGGGVAEQDQVRLTQTGITPGTAPEFAAAHIEDLKGRGIDVSPQRQAAILDLYRQEAGVEARTVSRNYFAETQGRRRAHREQTIVGRFQNAGLNVLSNLGETAYNAIGVVDSEYANELGDEYEALLNPNVESLSGGAGQVFAEVAKLATFARTGPKGMAAIYGAQGFGGTRRRVEELRSAGADISHLEEYGTAAGVGSVEAASGFVGGKIFQSMSRTMQKASPTVRGLIGRGDPGAIRSFVGQSLSLSGHALAEGTEEALTQTITNYIQQGIDPELAISEGVLEAFKLGVILAPFGAAGAQGTIAQEGAVQRQDLGTGTLTPAEAMQQAADRLPESTPHAVPPRTALERRLIGEEATTPPQTDLEQQLVGQQATPPTAAEQQAFFGTGVSDPTITEEARFLSGTRPDRPEQFFLPESEATERLNQSGMKDAAYVRPDDTRVTPDLQQVATLGEQFGTPVVLYSGGEGRAFKQGGTLFINVERNPNGRATREAFSHELWHSVQDSSPELSQEVYNAMPKKMRTRLAEEYMTLISRQQGDASREAEARLASDPAEMRREVEAFAVGRALASKRTFNAAFGKDPSMAKTILERVVRAFRSLTATGRLTNKAIDVLQDLTTQYGVEFSPDLAQLPSGSGRTRLQTHQRDLAELQGKQSRATSETVKRQLDQQIQQKRDIIEAISGLQRNRYFLPEGEKTPVANKKVRAMAAKYAAQHGLKLTTNPKTLNPLTARRLARAYEDMEHDPADARVAASYEAFMRETLDQFNGLKADGFLFEPWEGEGQPYADAAEMARDVAENRHLYFYKTEGTDTSLPDDHPMKRLAPGTGGLLYNDVFRAIHDVYGHTKDGYGFDVEGEENAWRAHSQMYSDLARGAMTTETRGQSTWVGYGAKGAANRAAIAEGREGDIVFAPQKAGLLPQSFWTAAGLPDLASDILPAEPKRRRAALKKVRAGQQAAAKATPMEGTEHQRRVPQSLEDWMTPISSRIRDISARVFNFVMRMEYDTAVARERLKKELHDPAARITQALGNKHTPEYRKFKRALLNGDRETAESLLPESVRPDLESFYVTFRNLFDNMRAAGVTIGDLGPDYWARYVKDYRGFKAVFGKDTGVFEEAWDLARAVKGRRLLTADEKAEIANAVIQGYGPRKPGSLGIANARQRTIDEIPDDALDFYVDPMEAAFRYIDGATYAAERSRFLGRHAQDPDQIEASVGAIVERAVSNDQLSPDAQAELHDLLTTRFTADLMHTSKWVRNFKQLVYLSVLGQFRSTVTQLTDTGLTAVTHGPTATVKGAAASLNLTSAEKRLVMEDIGIHDHGEEFKDIGKLARATDWTLRKTGFKAVDRFGKETRINGAFEAMKTAASNPRSQRYKRMKRDYKPVLGDAEFEQVMLDLRNGNKTEDVKYLLFLDLAKIQPVVTSQMPKKYLDMPNGRIFYSLKTFTMMQLDFVRRDMLRKLATPGERREGLANLSKYIVFFGLMDLGVDLLKDLLRGKDITMAQVPDRAVDTMLAMVGMNRYTVEKAWTSPSDAAINFLAPPLSWIDAPFTDLTSDTEGLRTVRQIPIVGELLYYWAPFGRGFNLTREEAKREYRSKLKDLRIEAEKAYRDGDMDLVRKLLTIYNDRRRQGPGDGRKNPLGVSDLRRRTSQKEE